MSLRERKINLLRQARNLIASGYCRYVCNTLENSVIRRAPQSEEDWAACRQLRQYISSELAPCRTLERWLEEHRPHLPLDDDSRRTYRLQWIDWMIQQLEEQDD